LSDSSASSSGTSLDETSPAGLLFVISAPSGAGKTSLVKALVSGDNNIQVAISHTTRVRRPDEVDGVNYFFVDESKFQLMTQKDEFLEWAHVFGCNYGTSKQEANRILANGHHLVLEIDWQGAAQIRSSVTNAITTKSIFILPPSLEALRDRLEKRAQDDDSTVQHRMDAAISEISHYADFDYLLVNDSFDLALIEISNIVRGNGDHLRLSSQKQQLQPLISELLQKEQS
jgi:guanylate kinase